MSKYYAIKNGVKPGIYTNWLEAQKQVSGYKGAIYKSFKTEQEATDFLNNKVTNTTKVDNITNKVNDKKVNTPIKKSKKIIYKDGAIKPIIGDYDIVIYTDGSAVNYVSGYGFVVLNPINKELKHKDDLTIIHKQHGHIDHCTNQAAELYAIYHALVYVKDLKQKILIRSDCETAIKCVTTYLSNWKRNGYLTVNKEPIKNKEVIMAISVLLDKLNVKFEHIISHEGEYYNEMVDQLADLGVLGK